jgi:polysaccharide deacetylase family protein (PEP-CTERM system associated)
MEKMVNAFTVDFEDWYQGLEIHKIDTWHKFESRIERNCQKILEVLKAHDVKATFFVLGYLAEKYPHLIKMIHELGHEVGSHGYSHSQVFRLTPEQFSSEISRTNEAVHKAIGKTPIGFRAPIFSIISECYWAFDVLAQNGFRYDSSIYPTFNYRYGMVKADRFRHERSSTDSNRKIIELPVATATFMKINLPVGGGAYFRIWPYAVTKWAFHQINRQGRPGIFYIHPWELDPGQPKIELPTRLSLTHYHRLGSTEKKLHRLLDDFQFSSMTEVFNLGY